MLLLGGLPIGAPIAHYGPFVMNSRDEIVQAIEDYQRGRLGIIPADQLALRDFAEQDTCRGRRPTLRSGERLTVEPIL